MKQQPLWVALFRGINVGGKNKLPMRDLSEHMEALGATSIQTYIQSGNVVFRASRAQMQKIRKQIGSRVETHHGFAPQVLVLGQDALLQAIAANPFPEAEKAPTSVHLYFLASKPRSTDRDAMDKICKPSERWELGKQVLYLHAPDGIGRSPLAARVEELLGVTTTARNWKTVRKLVEMADAETG